MTYPSGRKLTYEFDHSDRPRALSGTLAGVTTQYISSATYEPFGPLANLRYGNGLIERRATYDSRYRITSLDVIANNAPLAAYRYGYDATGNITSIADALDPRYNRSFGYDDLNRLTSSTSGSALWGSATWTYDAMGNRLAETLGGKTQSLTYEGSTPKIVSATENGRTRAIEYDPAGNERVVGPTSFTYSPRNSLETADGLRYIYDGTGVRVAQVGLAIGPVITEQPQSRSICPGTSATLSVRASGASSYQWETSTDGSAWAAISGATASTLTATPSTTAYYRAVTSNAAGATTSDIATLTPVALATEPATNILYGDITQDGAVNSADATFLRAVLAGTQPLAVPSAVADLNGDTKVDALDLALVTAYATSTITCLPQFPVTIATSASTAPVVATVASLTPVATHTSLNPTQYFFYTPEMSLLSHTTIQSGGGRPSIKTDYIWFAGLPVAQESPTAPEARFTFADHLGTPFLQTTHVGTPTWHIEYDPYGTVYRTRTGTPSDQRLRFPGQEYEEQTSEGAYNIFRWYRSTWGRYSSADPIGLQGGVNLYAYALDNPLRYDDPLGLKVRMCCRLIPYLAGARHCFFQFRDSDDNRPLSLHGTRNGRGYMRAIRGRDVGQVLTGDEFDQGEDERDVCGPWAEDPCNDVDKCVRNQGDQYPNPSRYRLIGPNSNTFAYHVARQCYVKTPWPVNAPGWNAPLPEQVK